MRHDYTVSGGVAGRPPGAYAPDELDGRMDWVPIRAPVGILDALESRLGSENDLTKVILAVLSPLRHALEGRPLAALLEKLPLDLAAQLADAEANVCAPVVPPAGAGDYVVEVSRLVLHPPRRAAGYVHAVFAAARSVLEAEDDEAIAARLPEDIAELWRGAR